MRHAARGSLSAPVLSVVLCTYNRASLLSDALGALVAQVQGTPAYEVVVVDNNSRDSTKDVVQRYSRTGLVRYEFEARQGLSYARNRGVSVSRADVIAFTDDDVRVSPDWVAAIVRAFHEHGTADLIGGRVVPAWKAPAPPWLSQAGDAPLALVDFGERPFQITPDRCVCLIGANVAVRRSAFERTGGFSPALQRVRNSVGSTEDYDFQTRVLAGGGTAVYEPRIVVTAPIHADRLTKHYHRAWHSGHGRFQALMRDPSFERSRRGAYFGVPAHVFRGLLVEAAAWILHSLSRRRVAAFGHELRLRFFVGFAAQRIFDPHGRRS